MIEILIIYGGFKMVIKEIKKKLLQINTVINSGSTGRIAEDIGKTVMKEGWESYIAYGRYGNPSQSKAIKIGTQAEIYSHVAKTRLFDAHGLGSKKGTQQLVKKIEQIRPDIIHLHNIHGYYLNYPILFEYLKTANIPVVWTLHDCWPFTGHCAYYDYVNCNNWQTHCGKSCPCKDNYPKSFVNRAYKNFEQKKAAFTGLGNLTLVPVSKWLAGELKKSFLKEHAVQTIHNGIDLNQFKPIKNSGTVAKKYNLSDKFIILGVASTWEKRKGLDDFIKLSTKLNDTQQIVLVGLSPKQIKTLPKNIIGIERTESVKDMAALYNLAGVFVNPTWEDNYPTTNLEATACETPVITYNTGGSPEAVTKQTGFVIEQGDVQALKERIDLIQERGKKYYTANCRKRAIDNFDKEDRYAEYLSLYEQLLKN